MKHIQNDKIVEILWKYLREESLTAGEKEILDVWLSGSPFNQKVFDEVMNEDSLEKDIELLLKRRTESIWNKIVPATREEDLKPAAVRMRNRWYNVAAAIVVVLILSSGAFFLLNQKFQKDLSPSTATIAAERLENDIAPGGNKAILTLANGSTITLDKVANGTLSKQGEVKINKTQDGQLVYEASNLLIADQTPLTFNTLSTPRGGQYQVILPDGSKVWLNAASTLRYPTVFNNKERVVELTGEAYFEIASSRNSTKVPFHVKANNMNVEVLGTHFNVNAYKDENYMNTTLLEGAVKVSQGAEQCLLKPGQRAEVANEELFPIRPFRKIHVTDDANVDEATAWKNGYFYFKSLHIENIMNQLSRWYNVNVIYQSTKPKGSYSGKVNRNTHISEVLAMLEVSGIRTRLNGNNIVVLP